jgi:hypothetical protein
MATIPPTAAVALALAAALTPGIASAAGEPAPAGRLHSLVLTNTADGVHVTTLQMFVRPTAGGRLRAHVQLTVTNRAAGSVRRVLELGTCTSGTTGNPSCPPAARRTVALAPGKTSSYVLVASLHRPGARLDAVQATVTASGAGAPDGRQADAELLLGSRAWTGTSAGLRYGIAFTPRDGLAVDQATWDLPSLGSDFVDMNLTWSGAPPSAVTTTLARCKRAACGPTTLRPQPARSGPARFGVRGVFGRQDADRARMTVTTSSGTALVEAMLPWPR